MTHLASQKPKLEIPQEVWECLADRDFVNFSVPLLIEPVESEDGLTWNGHELLLLSDTLAAFTYDEDAMRYMPYDEMFRVISNEGETQLAQIYAIFFEKLSGEWRMMYRLMNGDRLITRQGADLPETELVSNWMLTLTGVERWFTVDDYLEYYCKFTSYDRLKVSANIQKQLMYLEGIGAVDSKARVMQLSDDIVVLVPKLTKGHAVMFDIVKNTRLATFVMDDPPHLIERFWRLHSKMFLSRSDRMEMQGMICDARHFSYAIKAAREQMCINEKITAAAFYCDS